MTFNLVRNRLFLGGPAASKIRGSWFVIRGSENRAQVSACESALNILFLLRNQIARISAGWY